MTLFVNGQLSLKHSGMMKRDTWDINFIQPKHATQTHTYKQTTNDAMIINNSKKSTRERERKDGSMTLRVVLY